MNAALLIEIGVEELPPAAMQPLARSLAGELAAQLEAAGLPHGDVEYFATPRRLAVRIARTAATSLDKKIEKKGPDLKIAYDDQGNPTRAGEGFARSVGARLDDLEVEAGGKGRRLVYRGTHPGRPLAALLQGSVDDALHALPIPKRMRWGTLDVAFVRPVHWVVALHGAEVLPLTVFGCEAGRTTYGHRFHHPEPIELDNPDVYVERLAAPGYVIADIVERRRRLLECVEEAATSLGGRALVDDALVDEVVALVEWPVGVAGRFARRYLDLPREVIVATLQDHQRYFPVVDEHGALAPGFVTIANVDSRDPAQVVAGNERVIAPRLADALFFWEQDKQRGLAARLPELARVSFQKKLGSMADKSARMGRIAAVLAPLVHADAKAAARAAELAKTDLLTDMVDEFPELQGIMGGYYAAAEGESEAVARALPEQYAPAGSGAAIPATPVGRCIALADKLDTLAGMFTVDRRPGGDRDPFGLRRAALGVLRILIEGGIHADLWQLLDTALHTQPITAADETLKALWAFHVERLRGYYSDQGIPAARFESIAALHITDVLDFEHRLRAVSEFVRLAEAPVVCGAHKRIRNILKRNTSEAVIDRPNPSALSEAAELQLYESLQKQTQTFEAAEGSRNYAGALSSLAPLAEPLNTFFDEVMVMSDDPAQRHNRLSLLSDIDRLCRRVADISRLSVEAN